MSEKQKDTFLDAIGGLLRVRPAPDTRDVFLIVYPYGVAAMEFRLDRETQIALAKALCPDAFGELERLRAALEYIADPEVYGSIDGYRKKAQLALDLK